MRFLGLRTSEFRGHVDRGWHDEFPHGYRAFVCRSLSRLFGIRFLAAAVCNPFYNELFTAARGRRRHLQRQEICVSKTCDGFDEPARVLVFLYATENFQAPILQYYGDFKTQNSNGKVRSGWLVKKRCARSRPLWRRPLDGLWGEFSLRNGILLPALYGRRIAAGNVVSRFCPGIFISIGGRTGHFCTKRADRSAEQCCSFERLACCEGAEGQGRTYESIERGAGRILANPAQRTPAGPRARTSPRQSHNDPRTGKRGAPSRRLAAAGAGA